MINSRIPSNLLVSRIAADIVTKQHDLAKVQEQIASGKQVNRPSDEPAQAARLVSIREATSQLDQFQRNASNAESQLSLEETALTGVTNSLNRIRELALSANNGIADDYSRAAVSSELQLRLGELYEMANARDSFGNYLFGGSNTETKPFSQQVPVLYSGEDDSHHIPIGLGRTIQTSDSGKSVFMRIRNGNGDFSVQSDPANTGTGLIGHGSVVNSSLYDAAPYSLQFTSTTTFDIVNDDTGATVSAGNTYDSPETVSFNGIQTSISGVPQTGDSFTIQPSQHQDVFSTVARFIEALDSSPDTAAEKTRMQQSVNEVLANIDNSLDHFNTLRARVGTRLASIDTSRDENASMALQLERTLADVEDIDIAEAVTSLQTQANSLEILQKSYSRIEGLSLFNYL